MRSLFRQGLGVLISAQHTSYKLAFDVGGGKLKFAESWQSGLGLF